MHSYQLPYWNPDIWRTCQPLVSLQSCQHI